MNEGSEQVTRNILADEFTPDFKRYIARTKEQDDIRAKLYSEAINSLRVSLGWDNKQNVDDIQQYMNIGHYGELMNIFRAYTNEKGTSDFSIDKFREVISRVLGDCLSFDQVTRLFMKIDANSDGSVTWDEFSDYMISLSFGIDEDTEGLVYSVEKKRIVHLHHKDPLKYVAFNAKERKYVSVSREGNVSIYGSNFKLLKLFALFDLGFHTSTAWVLDVYYVPEFNKYVIISDNRTLVLYDLMSIKPRFIYAAYELENNPTCCTFIAEYNETDCAIVFGDDGGAVNFLVLPLTFWSENSTETTPSEKVTPAMLTKTNLNRNQVFLIKKQVHTDVVKGIIFDSEMNIYISISDDINKSMVIGDVIRNSVRAFSIPKGTNCVVYCKRPSSIITGGKDKLIRIFNPYLMTNPPSVLQGHEAPISNLAVDNTSGFIISLSDDRVIKIWYSRSMACLQTLNLYPDRSIEDCINYFSLDRVNNQILLGSDVILSIPMYHSEVKTSIRTHEAPILTTLYNANFHQVVSICEMGTVALWDVVSGSKIFEFKNIHEGSEVTAACFDASMRRLITGSKNGSLKLWNFNNGQLLKVFDKGNSDEVSGITYVDFGNEKYIVATGWDKNITVFIDDSYESPGIPIKIINTVGTTVQPGHIDDISCISFCPPNMIATGGADGRIVIWNMNQCSIRQVMFENLVNFKAQDEIAIEQVIFTFRNDMEKTFSNSQLLSCHADGFIRLWDPSSGVLQQEMNVESVVSEGMDCMIITLDSKWLIIGGSKGSVRIVQLEVLADGSKKLGSTIAYWMAHNSSVMGIDFAIKSDVVITASTDCSVRLWTRDGIFIGSFGQQDPWLISDSNTFAELPMDILIHYEKLKRKCDKNQRKKMNHIRKFDLKKDIETRRAKQIRACVDKWKDFTLEKKVERMQVVGENRIVIHSRTGLKIFSLDIERKDTKTKSKLEITHNNVYRLMTCYDLADIPVSTLQSRKVKVGEK